MAQDLVEKAECLGLFRRHISISIESLFNGFHGLAGMTGVDFVKSAFQFDDFLGMPGDIGGLAVIGS